MLAPFEYRPNGEGTEPVYRFRRPTVAEKNFAFKRAVRAAGGVWHGEFDLLACLARGVKALLKEPAFQAPHLAAIDHYRRVLAAALARREAARAAAETVLPPKEEGELTEAEREAAAAKAAEDAAEAEALAEATAAVQAIGDEVRRGYPRFAAMEADREAFFTIRGMAAAEMFGIGLDAAAVPPEHFEAIGVWCQALFAPGEPQRKNSNSPSGMPATAATAPDSSTSAP